MAGIYIIKNNINNKVYIGSTLKSINFRFKTHIKLLNNSKHENPLLQNAWNKYGVKNFTFEVIEKFENITIDELLLLEQQYISKFNSIDKNFGYNICKVGKSRAGCKWNDESKKKRCGSGNPMFGKGYLRRGKLNPMFGKSLSESHKNKMSMKLRGMKKPIIGIKLSKPVIMLDIYNNVVDEFSSCSEATNITKILHISEVCNNQRKTAGGYIW